MIINFSIHYYTHDKEVLSININDTIYPMKYCGNGMWYFEIETNKRHIKYSYSAGNRKEYTQHNVTLNKGYEKVEIRDFWNENPKYPLLYSSPFINIFNYNSSLRNNKHKNICLHIECPYIHKGEVLAITGSSESLGCWDLSKAIKLNCKNYPNWGLYLDKYDIPYGTEYKFVIINNQNGNITQWENGENRVWDKNFNDDIFYYHTLSPPRIEECLWRGAGVAIPIFSLRSNNSAGIGDFDDLSSFVKWSASVGMQIVQILPINDTTITKTYKDSYPYNSVSVFALHPLYMSLDKMGELKNKTLAKQIKKKTKELNELESLDYNEVYNLKWKFFKEIYKQEGNEILKSKEFKKFYNKNKYWLIPYAVFCYMRDKNSTANYSLWNDLTAYDEKKAKSMLSENYDNYHDIVIHIYVQFYLDKQLKEVRINAAKIGIALKGDIPIGVGRYSVETWTHPNLFNLSQQAGAPPDEFSQKGQNWGFPTYNWDEMAKDNYNWWKNRFTKMYDYFELYRIDHILGFFRIWQIPSNSIEGLLGNFEPALPLSCEELKEYGIAMDKEKFLKPFIFIEDLDNNIINEFFEPTEQNNYFTLKEEFNSQRKIETYLSSTNREHLKEKLFNIVNDVLFIRDSKEKEKFHPRITLNNTFAYNKLLNDKDRENIINLYNNYYYHRHNYFWAANALKKLPSLISTTPMLCCAEDLGMIPDCVPEVLDRLKIITLEIERMPKNCNYLFGQVSNYPYLSVCTTSTHDMSTIRMWWKEMQEHQRDEYYNNIIGSSGKAPKEDTTDICKNIIYRHLNSPSVLSIIPLQDFFSVCDKTRTKNIELERINIPSDSNHYWRYRMHITIEEMQSIKEFNSNIKNLIKTSGR